MFRIGEFSKIAQTPISQLRYYDEIGLFTPAHIDRFTGYRYYSARQLPHLNRIIALKELGMSLDQIKRLLEDNISVEEIRGMLTLKKAQVEQALYEEVTRLRHIEARLQQIDASPGSPLDIVLKEVPAQPYLSRREIFPNIDMALDLMQQIVNILPAHMSHEALGHCTAVVHSETLDSSQLDIELGVILNDTAEVTIELPDTRLMTVRLLPAVALMATVVRIGGFENSCRSYGAIGLWVEENGYRIIGPVREVLIRPPRTNDLNEMVTELQFPVEPTRNTLPDNLEPGLA
jgi:DNA-binding transcriptional MerR regulator